MKSLTLLLIPLILLSSCTIGYGNDLIFKNIDGSIGLVIITAIITTLITHYFTIDKIKTTMQLNHKEKKYEELLIAIRKALYQDSSNTNMQIFLDTKVASYLYASDEVIDCIEEIVKQYIVGLSNDKDSEDTVTKNKNLINAIRKDLGAGKSKLDERLFDFDYTLHN